MSLVATRALHEEQQADERDAAGCVPELRAF